MTTRLRVERIPKTRAEPVGLDIHVGLDERTAVRSIQFYDDLALVAAQLIDGDCERVAGDLAGCRVAAAQADGRRAICAEDEQAAAAEFTAEVQEKGRGGVVYPLQIIEEQQQGLLSADCSQSADQLVEQGDLRKWNRGVLLVFVIQCGLAGRPPGWSRCRRL